MRSSSVDGFPVRAFRVACWALAAAVLVVGPAAAQQLGISPEAASTADAPATDPFRFGLSVDEAPDGLSDGRREDADEGSGSWFFRSWRSYAPQDTAERTYDDAMKALEAGKTAKAQRLFEQLIADAPRSKLAGEARSHLGRLYRRQAAETKAATQTAKAVGAAAMPWTDSQTAEARPASLEVAPPVPRSVLLAGRVSRFVDDEFLRDAGDRVFFGAGSADLGIRAHGVIRAQARFLIQRPELAAVVEGHADDGELPDDETLRLSQARALAVRDRLVAEGVDVGRLTAYGRGREERVADCAKPDCMAQNRRAITILLDGPNRLSQQPMRESESASRGAPTQ